MQIKICQKISMIDRQQWNALVMDNNPFIRYEFLAALEQHQCVGETFGWLPCHIAIYEDNLLIGAMPLYEKHNSYGEFVFDNAWAGAYRRHGMAYYPKLVSSIPYTPAQGQRLLAQPEQKEKVYGLLLETIKQLSQSMHSSGFHCLFPQDDEHQWLQSQGLFSRYDCQFHWHNDNYRDFDDFLSRFSSKKRKNIRKERRKVEAENIQFRILDGHSASDQDWQDFGFFYQKTFTEKWGIATLNTNFFKEIAQQLPDQIVLVLASQHGQSIAGSLMYRSDSTLYGRFWGCIEEVDCLHFEACYYQGIEYCIKHGLQKFEPGAQGEHKVARGFLPTLTKSSHFLTESGFQTAITQYVQQEHQAILDYMQGLNQHLPYKTPLPLAEPCPIENE